MEILLPVLAGFTLGCVHAFDADHIVAITAFTSKPATKTVGKPAISLVGKSTDAKRASWLGMLWGLGHTVTLLVLGLLSLLFKIVIPPMIESIAELAVGGLLIAIGVWVLVDLLRQKHIHIHKHEHDGVQHFHFHSHEQGKSHRHKHTVFFVGAAHGMAGTASVLVIVPVTITQSILAASLYLLLFGLGTIVAMAIFAHLMGIVSRVAQRQGGIHFFQGAAGIMSVLLGSFWIASRIF